MPIQTRQGSEFGQGTDIQLGFILFVIDFVR